MTLDFSPFFRKKYHFSFFPFSFFSSPEKLPLTLKWLASNLFLQNTPGSNKKTNKNEGDDPKLKKLLIDKQLLLVSTLENVWRAVWRICILTLGCKGFRNLAPFNWVNVVYTEHCQYYNYHITWYRFLSDYSRTNWTKWIKCFPY